jgi:hypothetical protein
MAIGPRDRIYAADERTGAVHVFEPSGKRLLVCKPMPDDFSQALALPSLTVNDTGEVFLGDEGPSGFVRFAADGTRRGMERRVLDSYFEDWLAQPGTGRTWVVGYEGVCLIEADRRIVRSVARAPDGTWLRGLEEAAVAPDGRLALVSSHSSKRLHLYSAAGEPERSLDLPPGLVTWSPVAFDGARLAFLERETGSETLHVGLFDVATGRHERLSAASPEVPWTPCFAAAGKELWLFDGERRIERYALE